MKFLLTCTALIAINGLAQNLVPNNSFETITELNCGISFDLESSLENWTNPTTASPLVYFTTNEDSCYNHQPTSTYGGPIGLKGSQTPRTGDVMIGLWSYTIDGLNQRQYVQIPLSSILTTGEKYIVSFYTSLADSMEYAADGIGIYLSVDAPSSDLNEVLDYEPQVKATEVVDNYSDWVLISDTITATEDYAYLTIGNFYDDAATNLTENPVASGLPGTYGAYFFIDDIRVEHYTENTSSTPTIAAPTITTQFYPNTKQLEIHSSEEVNKTVHIYSILGELVAQQASYDPALIFDMNHYPPGMYIAKISYKNKTLTKKIIIRN